MSNIIIGKTLLSSNTPKRGDKGILINKKYFIPFSSGNGNEFYKCTSVQTPQQVTFYRVSNAEYTVVNGDYKNSGSSYNGQPIYSYTNTTNNITYYLFYSGYNQWGITDTTDYDGDFVFYSDCFYTSDDSNVTGEWWVSNRASGLGYENTPPTVTAQTEEVGNKTWSGKKAVLNNGVYEYESDSTSDLEYSSITPVVGRVYNENALASIGSLYTGIPEEGLVFYAPLKENSAIAITGQNLSTTGTVTYQTFNRIPCVYFNGSSKISTTNRSGFESILFSQNLTSSFWVYRGNISSFSSWEGLVIRADNNSRSYGTFFNNGSNTIVFQVYNERNIIPSFQNYFGKWTHICQVIQNNVQKCYINGTFIGSVNIDRIYDSSSSLQIGGWSYGYLTGYISSVRIYNRALSEDEIILLSNEFLV